MPKIRIFIILIWSHRPKQWKIFYELSQYQTIPRTLRAKTRRYSWVCKKRRQKLEHAWNQRSLKSIARRIVMHESACGEAFKSCVLTVFFFEILIANLTWKQRWLTLNELCKTTLIVTSILDCLCCNLLPAGIIVKFTKSYILVFYWNRIWKSHAYSISRFRKNMSLLYQCWVVRLRN